MTWVAALASVEVDGIEIVVILPVAGKLSTIFGGFSSHVSLITRGFFIILSSIKSYEKSP